MKTRRTPRPTEQQTRILRRIAQSGGIMMLTHNEDGEDRFSDSTGVTVNANTAKVLIRNGWVIANRDSIFDLSPQSWR